MKKIVKICATAALVLSYANSTFAANQSTDLKVQGTLTMGSCTPTLSSGGVVDYGKLSIATLDASAVNQMGEHDITLSLTCVSPTKVGFSVVDDRTDSVADTAPSINGFNAKPSQEFGLGKTAGGVNLGSFAMLPYSDSDHTFIDDKPGSLTVSWDKGAHWLPSTGFVNNDGSEIVSFADANGAPVALTTASDVIGVNAAIQDTTTLAITDDTSLDGQATISVVYL
ncbi:DUF1120 domain-containing protein [Enterobacter sp. Acro-832]|uniref:DUF1120 domain-containing protein n=1 Tax=Enterobacter sp. Acro-832 TaxID=2608348 RepID=UPI001421E008|nr:DUF1120 domain-containing protein [Enterobacter sp. Acro-832]NIG46450.1 DUF1120 domain-containing protein [Enterobacter sp. Acro-832]HAY7232994.1 DUF1120 domain-containing protein [Shigella sonnei]